jgi:uncharacterized protein (DUF1015 family)
MTPKPNVHHLAEYGFAKQVVEEIPEIMIELERTQAKLYKYNHYKDVADILWAINDAKVVLDIHFSVYKDIYDKKAQQ